MKNFCFLYQIAVDLSTSMMAKAQQRLTNLQQPSISWIIHDLNNEEQLPIVDSSVDAIISTLVLEHIVSLEGFFQTIFRLLKKNETSWVFITAMHSNMYQAGSQAGFVIDETTGEKLCGMSFDHSSEEIILMAKKKNFILIKYLEKGVNNDEDIQRFGCRAKKWKGMNIHASFLFRIVN